LYYSNPKWRRRCEYATMSAEEQERGLEVYRSCEEDAVDKPTEALNYVERTADHHQNGTNSNLDMGIHHRETSPHPHRPVDSSSDSTSTLFSHNQQNLQAHGCDLNTTFSSHNQQYQHHQQHLQQQGQRQHNLNLQSKQQQQHQFSYHFENHISGDDEDDAIVEATTALPHDISVGDVGRLYQHSHTTDIPLISNTINTITNLILYARYIKKMNTR